MIYVTLAANEPLHDVLKHGVKLVATRLPTVRDEACGIRLETITLAATSGDVRGYFDKLAPRFEKWLSEDHVTVLISDIALDDLAPMTPTGSQGEALLSMLILAFPEIRWLFGAVRGLDAEIGAEFVRNHGIHRLFKDDGTPLFDGRGLRDWVRTQARKAERQIEYLPERRAVAVAMDEELDYAYLHAWAAYRFGFRAGVVARKQQANQWVGDKNAPPCLVLEDLYLNFPDYSRDREEEHGLSDLQTRERKLPGLANVPYRAVVTVGHQKKTEEDKERRRRNHEYFNTIRAGETNTGHRRKIWYARKPHAGIFSFWRRSGLAGMRFDACRKRNEERGRLGKAPGFDWPPEDAGEYEASGHSSPGILVEIARHMLNRAEGMLNDGIATVEQAVRGAVLANDALELLGCKTPTMSAEALALKHQFELHAECQFCGIDHHLEMGERLKEIKRDAEAIARWFNPGTCQKTALNIRLDVINKLVRILREYNQFDEERVCMREARKVHRALYVGKNLFRRIFVWPFLTYAEWLLASFRHFIGAIFMWLGGAWLLYSTWFIIPKDENEGAGAFDYAIGRFLSVDTLPDQSVFSAILIFSGLFHLGIFISMVYELVNRR